MCTKHLVSWLNLLATVLYRALWIACYFQRWLNTKTVEVALFPIISKPRCLECSGSHRVIKVKYTTFLFNDFLVTHPVEIHHESSLFRAFQQHRVFRNLSLVCLVIQFHQSEFSSHFFNYRIFLSLLCPLAFVCIPSSIGTLFIIVIGQGYLVYFFRKNFMFIATNSIH